MEAPPIIGTPRKTALGWPVLAAAAAVMAAAAVLFLFNPSRYGFYPRCQLYVATGIYCPGCGSLRALHELTHGHLLAALRSNLPLVLALPVAAFFSWRWLRGKPLPEWLLGPRMIIALSVAALIFTILRNIRVAPFIYLAPPG